MKGFALLLALLPLAASAATITVTSTADNTTAGNGKCTLREAIANVNAAADTSGGDCTAGSGAGDTIKFGVAMPAKIKLGLGELKIQSTINITNPAPGALRVDAAGKSRVFEIAAGTTYMSGLTIESGNATFGGGILVNQGTTLKMANCVVAGNSVSGGQFGYYESDSDGGGIYNAGTLNLTDCRLTRNTAFAREGSGVGGGIYNASGGTATLTNSVLSGNRTRALGEYAGDGRGGAIFNDGGTVVLTNCTLTRNRANAGADGVGLGGGICNADGVLTLAGCRFVANRASNECPVNDCTGFADGGAISNGIGAVSATNCTFSRNIAIAASSFVEGGALYNEEGDVTLTDCTLDRNAAFARGDSETYGGAISNEGFLTMTNCTLVGSSAKGLPIAEGGAINNGGGNLTLTNCTVTGNKVQRNPFNKGTGGISGVDDEYVILTNTIVANNGPSGNCDDTTGSGGHNLSSDGTCFPSGGSDLLNTKPQLAVLGNYGGPTQTMALCTAAGIPAGCHGASPAIDAGDDSVTGPPDSLATDQRGLPRLSGAHVDIGAYEVQ